MNCQLLVRGGRSLFVPVLLAFVTLLCFNRPGLAQEGESGEQPEPEASGPLVIPTPRASELGLEFPEGVKPKAASGETLLYASGKGKAVVVRLHATAGEKRLVMLPSGKLVLVDASRTRPTTEPFVAATTSEVAQAMRAEGFGAYKVVEADPYVFVYACSEAFYMHTRSILETLYPGVMESLQSWGLEPVEPETPLVVVITPNRAAFDTYAKMPAGVAAYYNTLSNYVILYEDTRLAFAAPDFALKQGAYTIAHEGVHQILHNSGVQRRMARWPMWISEGLPEFFCPLNVSSRLVTTGSAQLPERTLRWSRAGSVNDLRMFDLLRTPTDEGDVIKTVISAPGLTARGYSLSWGLVHYLATRRKKEFQAYLQEVRKVEPFDPVWEDLGHAPDPLFARHFGEDFVAIEHGVQKHLTDNRMQREYKDPFVYQTHYVVKRILKKGRTFSTAVVITTSPEAARKWKEAEEAKLQAADESARFYTIVCDTRKKAEYQIRKLLTR